MDENELNKSLAQCKGAQEVQVVCASFLRTQQERMDDRIRTFIQQQQDQFERIRLRTKTERDRILRYASHRHYHDVHPMMALQQPSSHVLVVLLPPRARSSSLSASFFFFFSPSPILSLLSAPPSDALNELMIAFVVCPVGIVGMCAGERHPGVVYQMAFLPGDLRIECHCSAVVVASRQSGGRSSSEILTTAVGDQLPWSDENDDDDDDDGDAEDNGSSVSSVHGGEGTDWSDRTRLRVVFAQAEKRTKGT
uniref:Uncharacterized protein n=1 Tax=Plectus sambesii TaxID=2011161 RepID=A0A914UKJ3_9BILA